MMPETLPISAVTATMGSTLTSASSPRPMAATGPEKGPCPEGAGVNTFMRRQRALFDITIWPTVRK